MGRAELIESLRSKAAEDVQALWADARARAEAYRADLAKSRELRRAQQAEAAAAAASRLADEATAEARHQARELRARAVLALAERLERLAFAELPRLRGQGGEALFAALAEELPPRTWDRIRVNPADASRARSRFPQTSVVSDAGVSGGLEAEAEDGRVLVSNTLDTRLATAWPDIVPELVAGLLPESHERRTPV